MANTTVTGADTTPVTLTEDDTVNASGSGTGYTTTSSAATPDDDTLTVNSGASLAITSNSVAVTLNLSAAPAGNGGTGFANGASTATGAGQGVVITNNGTISTVGSRVIDTTSTAGGGTTTATGAEVTLNNAGTIQSSGGNTSSKGDLFRVNYDMPSGVVNVYNTGTMSAGVDSNDSQGVRLAKLYTAKSILIDNGENASGTMSTNTVLGSSATAPAIITTADADAVRPGGVDPGGTAANIGAAVINNYGTITAHAEVATGASLNTINAINGVDISMGQSVTVNNLTFTKSINGQTTTIAGTISGDESGLGSDVANGSTTATPVTFAANYTVNNQGTITGYNGSGVAANAITGTGTTATYSGTATINNYGTIQGEATGTLDNDGLEPTGTAGGGTVKNAAGVGVDATNAVTVYNAAGATISGSGVQGTGNILQDAGGTGGAYASAGSFAIEAGGTASGTVTNPATGAATVVNGIVNFGTIQNTTAANGTTGGAILLNDAAGTTNTISNYGTISGSNGQAIIFKAGNDTLNLYAGESITGTVTGGSGTSTVNLASYNGNTAGTVTGFTNFSALNVNSGTWTVTDAETYAGGENIAAGATLVLAAAGSTSQVNFANATTAATLSLASAAQPASGGTFGGTLNGFGGNNIFDLQNFAFAASDTASYANGTLTVANGTTSEAFTLANPTSTNYALRSDGNGGTDVVVCFAAGTRILTERGEVAVEELAVGDRVVTASGARRPICWLGHRVLDCSRHPDPAACLPVRVAAGAVAPGRPARDLLVSPGHSLCVEDGTGGEALVPAAALVNGATIRQVAVERVAYWHVELDGHDILLADGMPAESYLEMANRSFFGEVGAVALHARPDVEPAAMAATHADFCRPFHADGPVVEAVRARLAARAAALGWTLRRPALGEVRLVVDGRAVEPVAGPDALHALLPAGAAAVWVEAPTQVPAFVGGRGDGRTLGLCLAGVTVESLDHAESRRFAADHPSLVEGFHEAESASLRWSAGRARLPEALWAGMIGPLLLRLHIAHPLLPQWIAPPADDGGERHVDGQHTAA